MPANTLPIYTVTPQISWGKVTGVDGSEDGTDADVKLVLTAGSNGAFINKIVFTPISTSGSTTTSQAAGRVYINNGSAVGTAGNNVLYKEINLPATAVDVAKTSPAGGSTGSSFEMVMNIQLKAAYTIYVGITAMAANTQWNVVGVFGDY